MIIKNLKLQNYRRFSQLDIEFPENLIGIIGRNGSGKSTIIEAIGWVLYGNTIARSEKQEIRSQFEETNPCSVEMVFNYGGHEYKIIRTLKGKNAISEAAVYRDGNSEPEAVQDRGVNQFIEELLKLDRQSFITSVYARQKDLAALSSMKPEERRKNINRLINIDLIDKAREKVRRDKNDKLKTVEGISKALKDEKVLAETEKSVLSQLKDKEKEEKKLKVSVEKETKQLSLVKEKLGTQEKTRDVFAHWSKEIAKGESRLKENIESKNRLEKEFGDIKRAEKELAQLEKELVDFDSIKERNEQLNKAATLFSKLEGKRKNLEILSDSIKKEKTKHNELEQSAELLEQTNQQLADNVAQTEELENNISALEEQLKKVHSEKSLCTVKGKEAKQKLEKIEELGSEGECPICTQTLGNHYDHVSENFQAEIEKLRTDYKKFDTEEKQLKIEADQKKQELSNLRKTNVELNRKQSKAQEAATALIRSQESIDNFSKQINKIEQEIAGYGDVSYDETEHITIKDKYENLLTVKTKSVQLSERVSRKISVQSEIQKIEKNMAETNAELAEFIKKQKDLNFDENEYLESKNNVEEQTRELDKVRETFSTLREELAGLKKEKEQIEQQIKEQENLRNEIKNEKEQIDYLTALDDHFGKFRLDLASRIRPLIAHRASELLSITTTSRYNLLHLDEDYNIQIYDGNQPFGIERFSGGEQDLANLCLRIAISQVVAERSGGAPINFVVLDEIFGSQDVERRDLILNALGQLSNQFRQIFIITHIEQIRDMLPVIIEVVQKDDQKSEAVLT